MRATDEDGRIFTSCKNCRHSAQCGEDAAKCEYEQGIALHYVFHIGKYKGKTLADVINEDSQYVLWMVANVKWFELSDTAKQEMNSAGHVSLLYDAEVKREEKFTSNKVQQ